MTRTPLPGGDLEHAVLVGLWELGTANTRELYERVGEPQGLVYTTVAKVLDRLHAKGLVTRTAQGKTFVYFPAIERAAVEQEQARSVISRLLGPTPGPAVAAIVDAVESIDPTLLDDLARAVAARRKARRGS